MRERRPIQPQRFTPPALHLGHVRGTDEWHAWTVEVTVNGWVDIFRRDGPGEARYIGAFNPHEITAIADLSRAEIAKHTAPAWIPAFGDDVTVKFHPTTDPFNGRIIQIGADTIAVLTEGSEFPDDVYRVQQRQLKAGHDAE